MTSITPARIFLSDSRTMRESAVKRSYSTFSGAQAHTPNFHSLYILDDEELAGDGKTIIKVSEDSYLLILPVTGDLGYKLNEDSGSVLQDDFSIASKENTAEVINIGELKINWLSAGSTVQLSNPFSEDTINYIKISIKADSAQQISSICNFDLETQDNQLINLISVANGFSVSIGRFKGRQNEVYTTQDAQNHVFSFVIAGAFELENCLIQPRDGLALSAPGKVEFEALSEGAILLMIEL